MTRVTLLSFLHVTGLTREAFDSLLYVVIPPGHTMRRRRRGRPWSLPPDGMLGLLLCYLGSQMTMKWLCLIFGITPTPCSRILKKILRMTVKRLRFHPLARIKFPDEQKMQQFAEMISIREPTISNVIGFMDGLGLATEMTDERIQQNACYCGYDCHSHHPGHLLPPPLCLHPPPRHHHHHYHSQHHRTKYYLPQLPRERCRHRPESGRTPPSSHPKLPRWLNPECDAQSQCIERYGRSRHRAYLSAYACGCRASCSICLEGPPPDEESPP